MGREVVCIERGRMERKRGMTRVRIGVYRIDKGLEVYKAVNISHWDMRGKLHDALIIMSMD